MGEEEHGESKNSSLDQQKGQMDGGVKRGIRLKMVDGGKVMGKQRTGLGEESGKEG